MKAYLADLVRPLDPHQGRNLAREYLQARVLEALQRAGAMQGLAFHGGTALRFLYATARYSEDLDFALEGTSETYDLGRYLEQIRAGLAAEGYAVELKASERTVVHKAFVRFPGLLYELSLSPHRNAVLAIKLEVDTRPPAGAGLATTLVRRHVVLHLQHHDPASLLAGKLHAILQRPYLKGRDLYDLVWYLGDRAWPPPNLVLLNNALRQSGWDAAPLTAAGWPAAIRERLEAADWSAARADVEPFLEPSAALDWLTLDNVRRLLTEKETP